MAQGPHQAGPQVTRGVSASNTRMAGEKQWENLNVVFDNFRTYIARKEDQNALSLIDLLYVSNFKGGNASIIDSESSVNARLRKYSAYLRRIRNEFGHKKLGELGQSEKDEFKRMAVAFIRLPLDDETKIRGFRASYASALLCTHFPDLAPVLDRNVLAGAGIEHKTNNQGQVADIQKHYGDLIDYFYRRLSAGSGLTLRHLDKVLFTQGRSKR